MQYPPLPVHEEIVEQRAIWRERLSAHAGGTGQQISRAQIGQVALERLEESGLAKIPIQLFKSDASVPGRQLAKAGVSQRLPELSRVDRQSMISLACERQDGIGA
jgi:hypothetical protein